MPEIRYYTVTQTREVKVWANSPADAALVADGKFNGHSPNVEGAATSDPRNIDLIVREDGR
jgi:hypothetical protein